MWTIINLLGNLAIAIQVVFLFTCGQDYMRMQIRRGKRNFEVTRLTYLAIAIASVCCALLYSNVPQPTEVLANWAVALLFATKSYSAWKFYARIKSLKERNKLR